MLSHLQETGTHPLSRVHLSHWNNWRRSTAALRNPCGGSLMKAKLVLISRILLGLIFFVFGLNGFLQFIPMPPIPEPAGAFLGALAQSGYFFPFLKTVEVLCGLAFLWGCFVPLALVVIAPVIVNIALFHLFLDPSGIGVGAVALLCWLITTCGYCEHFAPLFQCKAKPKCHFDKGMGQP